MIKDSIYQKDTTIVNVCATNNRDTKYVMQKYYRTEGRNRQIHKYSQIFNTPSQKTDRKTRQKII